MLLLINMQFSRQKFVPIFWSLRKPSHKPTSFENKCYGSSTRTRSYYLRIILTRLILMQQTLALALAVRVAGAAVQLKLVLLTFLLHVNIDSEPSSRIVKTPLGSRTLRLYPWVVQERDKRTTLVINHREQQDPR